MIIIITTTIIIIIVIITTITIIIIVIVIIISSSSGEASCTYKRSPHSREEGEYGYLLHWEEEVRGGRDLYLEDYDHK